MLPAYISYFLNLENISEGDSALKSSTRKSEELSVKGSAVEPTTITPSLFRALVIGVVTTSGFLILFTATGTIISLGARALIKTIPWIGLVIGLSTVAVMLTWRWMRREALGLTAAHRLTGLEAQIKD